MRRIIHGLHGAFIETNSSTRTVRVLQYYLYQKMGVEFSGHDSRRVALLLVPIKFPYFSSGFGHLDDAKPRIRFSRGLF